ncbi:hypothetical protein OFM36_37920, partial [Escherichia coli]|nr:hypothetical protein [Escherichia coli]
PARKAGLPGIVTKGTLITAEGFNRRNSDSKNAFPFVAIEIGSLGISGKVVGDVVIFPRASPSKETVVFRSICGRV